MELLFSHVASDSLRGNSLRLQPGRLRLDIRKNFLIKSVVKHCNKLPREVTEWPSLQVFKRCVDDVHGDTALVDLTILGLQLDLMISKFFPNPNYSIIVWLPTASPDDFQTLWPQFVWKQAQWVHGHFKFCLIAHLCL